MEEITPKRYLLVTVVSTLLGGALGIYVWVNTGNAGIGIAVALVAIFIFDWIGFADGR